MGTGARPFFHVNGDSSR